MELTKQIRFKDEIKLMTIEEVVIQFQGLVNKLLKPWIGKYEIDDLQQMGNIGLIKAFNKYDIDKEVLFTTYATIYISGQYSVNYRDDKRKNIHIDSLNKVLKFKDGEEIEQITLLKDETTNVEESAMNNFQCKEIHNILNTFSNRDRIIIELSFIEHKTQKDIASMLGISQVQVSRTIKKTLIKLRKELGD